VLIVSHCTFQRGVLTIYILTGLLCQKYWGSHNIEGWQKVGLTDDTTGVSQL